MPDNATEPVTVPAANDRLDSWKEIAAYLKREVRTVQLWEKREALPVHRHVHSGRPSVYAYKAELDAWWNNRRPKLEQQEEIAAGRRRWWRAAASLGAVAALVAFWFLVRPTLLNRLTPPRMSLEPGTVLPLPGAGFPIVGDFNNDGVLDLAATFNTGTYPANEFRLAVFLGTGRGEFADPVIYPPGPRCWTMQSPRAADLNNDGALDLILLVSGTSDFCFGNKFVVLLGDGRGGFHTPGREFITGGTPSSLVVGDFNEDGNKDLAVFCRDEMKIYVYSGTGSGDFAPGPQLELGRSGGPNPQGELCYTDLNADTHGDLLVSLYHLDVVKAFLGTGKGEFLASPIEFSVPTPLTLASAEFNGDGFPDYAVVGNLAGTVSVLLGSEGGYRPDPKRLKVADPARGLWEGLTEVATEDFDHDGIRDIAVLCGADRSVRVLFGDGHGEFSDAQAVPLGRINPKGLAVADLNGDRLKDLVVGNDSPPGLLIVWNRTHRSGAGKEEPYWRASSASAARWPKAGQSGPATICSKSVRALSGCPLTR
ncbi:MAG TPA: VCBS repeat-containing protein [Candidatus Xenobia bacterium]|nr:VCBS repeat-containing protein [Candidatus Xenobia bacterium]